MIRHTNPTGSLKNRRFRALEAVVALLFCLLAPYSLASTNDDDKSEQQKSRPLTIGQTVQDFTLKSYSGENIRLNELRGNIILINFWASWSGSSIKLLQQSELLQRKYADDGFTVMSISIDPDKAANALEKLNGEQLQLLDRLSLVSRQFAIKNIPSMFLIDRDGKVLMTLEGFDPRYLDLIENRLQSILKQEIN